MEDAGELAVFDYQVAVVLLVVSEVVVAVKKHFAQFGAAQRIVVNNAALVMDDPADQVVASVVSDIYGTV